MFFVNYNTETGKITSYQEGPDNTGNNPAPGEATLTFAAVVPGMISTNGSCLMKVDLTTENLVLLNPEVIPQPIKNPSNAAINAGGAAGNVD